MRMSIGVRRWHLCAAGGCSPSPDAVGGEGRRAKKGGRERVSGLMRVWPSQTELCVCVSLSIFPSGSALGVPLSLFPCRSVLRLSLSLCRV